MKLTLKKILLGLIGGMTLFVVAMWTWEWWTGTHYFDLTMQDKFEIELTSDECGTCFLDWQVDYYIEITDLKNNQEYDFDFFTSEGPYIRFCLSNDNPDLLLIEGYDYNDGLSWLINLNDNTIDQTQSYDNIASKNFVTTHELTEKFELKKK